jgi:hypothetical protein
MKHGGFGLRKSRLRRQRLKPGFSTPRTNEARRLWIAQATLTPSKAEAWLQHAKDK